MPGGLRKSGIDIVGDVPWGTHFCHLYETKRDLVDILVPYFRAGLESSEFCIWVVSDPLNEEEARSALAHGVPGTDRYMSGGDIEILRHSQWYLKDGTVDLAHTVNMWNEKLDQALSRGYAGLRVNGNETWLTERDWVRFTEYEIELTGLIAQHRMIVLCTYPLAAINAAELFDVARAHQFAIARRLGNWEILELEKLNDRVEQQVRQRTTALAEANQELGREIAQRKQAEAALRRLSGRLLRSQDGERRRLARELHDSTAQLLAGLTMNLTAVSESAHRLNRRAQRAVAESIALAKRCLREIRVVSYLLYPPELDQFGLQSALTRYVEGFVERSGIRIDLDVPADPDRLPQEINSALFRIVQEALTNVHRHSGSDAASIRLVRSQSEITVEIRDQGCGIHGDVSDGVGIASMRERVQELGGVLDILSTNEGTTIKAVIPLIGNNAWRPSAS